MKIDILSRLFNFKINTTGNAPSWWDNSQPMQQVSSTQAPAATDSMTVILLISISTSLDQVLSTLGNAGIVPMSTFHDVEDHRISIQKAQLEQAKRALEKAGISYRKESA